MHIRAVRAARLMVDHEYVEMVKELLKDLKLSMICLSSGKSKKKKRT